MKRFLLAVAAILVSLNLVAQNHDKSIVWYAKAGMNISDVKVKYIDCTDPVVGYHVGIAFDKPIGTSGLFWGSGLQLGTKGYKITSSTFEDLGEDEGMDFKMHANKLEIPVSIGYKIDAKKDFYVDARIGAFANYDVWGKAKIKADGESASVKIKDMVEYDRFSAGIHFGIGIWYHKFNFSVTYLNGLVKQNETKERTWSIGLGYAF